MNDMKESWVDQWIPQDPWFCVGKRKHYDVWVEEEEETRAERECGEETQKLGFEKGVETRPGAVETIYMRTKNKKYRALFFVVPLHYMHYIALHYIYTKNNNFALHRFIYAIILI